MIQDIFFLHFLFLVVLIVPLLHLFFEFLVVELCPLIPFREFFLVLVVQVSDQVYPSILSYKSDLV